MSKLSAKVKLLAVREVLENKKSLNEIALKYDCSRQILYSWVKKYRQKPEKGSKSLENRYKKGKNHPKKLGWQVEKRILDVVIKYPHLSVFKIRDLLREAGIKISSHGVHNVLTRYNLQTKELRERFSVYHPVKTVFAHALAPAHRAKVVEEFLEGKAPIAKVCAKWKVSRPTFYAWLARYEQAISDKQEEISSERIVEALIRKYKKGSEHHRASSYQTEEAVLDLIRQNPSFSAHKLAQNLKGLIGHHGIQNILARNELSTQDARVRWVQDQYIPEPIPVPVEAPVLSRSRLLRLIAHFRTIPKLVWNNPITWPFAVPVLLFVAYIFELDQAFRPTVLFPIIALTFGFVFLLYSFKYYASLILVLWLGSKQEKDHDSGSLNSDPGSGQNKSNPVHILQFQLRRVYKNTVERYVRKVYEGKGVGLSEDLSRVTLSRFPFVSVHLPIYNEKRVVERVMKACSAFEWSRGPQPNYEVIVIDDSTDETTEIAQKALVDDGWKVVKTTDWGLATTAEPGNDPGSSNSDPGSEKRELELFYATKAGKPLIKYIHRFSRAGFKGGALAEALRVCDSRAEYILVFDADFVPYPDTIEQFVKYFQLSAGNTRMDANGGPFADVQGKRMGANERMGTDNKIAAIQGYQWHVLNKSENWITRGVRSEYAGSYVVERSAIELYGGLKMIAGSVYAIRADILRRFGWGRSITEDFELTLKLYEAGYKVVYTPYIQAPAEAVSTIRRMIRQRMRWAEGHSFNIRHHLKAILNSRQLTRGEKFEFAFLGPYYLQAAFFVVGTLAWFLSETVLHVSLPYWTAALGWSLVFTNFLALPLINLLGLFLEQSEEKDYLGVASFILLSYIVTPFQAYAAVKGFLEKEEGPWFRTPKSGKVTDVIGRVRIGHWSFGWPFGANAPQGKPFGGRPTASPMNADSALISAALEGADLAFASAKSASSFNPLHGYSFKPRRISLVSRSVIAGLLIVVMTINYLAFFAEPKSVEAVGTPKQEQQINIIDQSRSSTSTTFAPTDNSLGLIYWESSKFSDISAVYFEAVIKNSSTANTTTVALFTEGGTEITEGTDCQVSTTSTSLTLVRTTQSFTTCPNYADNTAYTIRMKTSAGTASVIAARLIILQVGANNGSITKSQTQVEIGGSSAVNAVSASIVADPKYYCFDDSDAGTCSDPAGSVWSPTPTNVYFEGTVQASTSTVGTYPSLELDSSGFPVISYYDETNADLKLVHCNDVNCAGGNDNINTVDATDNIGQYTSLELDGSGFPVISYYASTGGNLKLAHCNDANCAGGNENINTPASTNNIGQYTSLELDSSGFPVISQYDVTNGDLRLVHCNDANCAGGGENDNLVEGTNNIGDYNSLELDGSGFPVISYHSTTDESVRLAHCNDANCAGGNENINEVDSIAGFEMGQWTYLKLDSSGFPVISYERSDDLFLAHCNDANCAGGNENENLVDTSANQSNLATSLELDGSGFPVIAYMRGTITKPYIAHCNDVNCAGGNENINEVDSANSNAYTSVKLDSSGFPVIAYQNATNGYLRAAHCNDANCAGGNESKENADTGNASVTLDLYDGTAQVSGSEVTSTSTSFTRVRSSAISLTAGKVYNLRGKQNGTLASGKIIIEQDATLTGGISALETIQHYNTDEFSTNQSTSFLTVDGINKYDDANWGDTWTGKAFFESTIKVSAAAAGATAHTAVCTVLGSCSTAGNRLGEVTTASATANRQRSSDIKTSLPTSATNLDAVFWCTSNNGCGTGNDAKSAITDSNSWLILQISSIPTPEIAILTLPGMILLPRLIRWFQARRRRKRKKGAAGGKPKTSYLVARA